MSANSILLSSAAGAAVGSTLIAGVSTVKPISSSHFLLTTMLAFAPIESIRSDSFTRTKEVDPAGRPLRFVCVSLLMSATQ